MREEVTPMIRPAAHQDAARLAEIEIFNYRLFFYPIFRTDRYFFSELTVPTLISEYRAFPEKLAHTLVFDDGVVKGFVLLAAVVFDILSKKRER